MRAKTAIWLIAITDILFGIHFAAWKLGFMNRPNVGIDPFAGYIAIWLVLFCVLTMVEIAAVVRDILKGGRRLPAIATSLLIVQGGLICFLYWTVMGV